MANYFMVRPLDEGVFFRQNVVALGWSKVDFSKYSANERFKKISELYPAFLTSKSKGRKMAQINRFCLLKKGDIIVVPIASAIRIARVKTGKLKYSIENIKQDQANQIEVEYLPGAIYRNSLLERFARRLRMPGSIVLDLNEFKDEIDSLIKMPRNKIEQQWQEERIKNEENFKSNLLKRIQDGDVYLPAGGIGLENLVRDLLEYAGYVDCKVMSKKTFQGSGDADVTAFNLFLDKKIYVQVKHHRGKTGITGIKQLEEIMHHPNKDDKHEADFYIFWTSADGLSVEAEEYLKNSESEIIVKTGKDLVDMIFDFRHKLSDDWKKKLGIFDIPEIIKAKK